MPRARTLRSDDRRHERGRDRQRDAPRAGQGRHRGAAVEARRRAGGARAVWRGGGGETLGRGGGRGVEGGGTMSAGARGGGEGRGGGAAVLRRGRRREAGARPRPGARPSAPPPLPLLPLPHYGRPNTVAGTHTLTPPSELPSHQPGVILLSLSLSISQPGWLE